MTDDVEGLLSEIATELSPERREEILSKGWDQMVTSLYAEVARSGEHGDYQRLAFESWIIDGKDELLERCAKSLAALQRERDELRKIISECATACGAGVAPEASVEFMALLPSEVKAVVSRYAYERDKAREERDQAESRSEAFWRGKVEALERARSSP